MDVDPTKIDNNRFWPTPISRLDDISQGSMKVLAVSPSAAVHGDRDSVITRDRWLNHLHST